jgi:imidazole glycerol-phosphate synthase subunit HisH
MIGIVNYGAGNVKAIQKIFRDNNIPHKIAETAEAISNCDKLILPGVGHYDYVIRKLKDSNLIHPLNEAVLEKKKPILGICVGMQILGNSSEEGNEQSLGWIPGEVKQFDKSLLKNKPYLPHMGWNTVIPSAENPLFKGINSEKGFYFVHSFYFKASNHDHVLSTTDYGITFHSSINSENIFGTQFHPEKSHRNGERLLINFVNL